MLKAYIQSILAQHPEFASVAPVIEKEILHHDVMHVMIERGVLQTLTFIGGTALRLCYNSSRLSEDLDFNGGAQFTPWDLGGLEKDIETYIQNKYDTQVTVNTPNEDKQGDTASWKISIERQPNRPDLPRQKIHIDVCALDSLTIEKRPLLNHYRLNTPTEGLLIPVQSLPEMLVDKFIALAYRARRIKPRDLWDIVWLHQQTVSLDHSLLEGKLNARKKTMEAFTPALATQIERLNTCDETRQDFNQEMARFIPTAIKARTLDNPDYWAYLQTQITTMAESVFNGQSKTDNAFDMGN